MLYILFRWADAGSCTHQCSFPLKQNVVYLHDTTGVHNIFLDKAIKNESAPNLCYRLTTQKQISRSFPSCGQMMFFHSWGWLKVLVKFFVCLFFLPHHHCVNYTNHLKHLFKKWTKTCEEELITVSPHQTTEHVSVWLIYSCLLHVSCVFSLFFMCQVSNFNIIFIHFYLSIFLSDFSLHTCLHLHC